MRYSNCLSANVRNMPQAGEQVVVAGRNTMLDVSGKNKATLVKVKRYMRYC